MFLDFTYKWYQMVALCLPYFTYCDNLWVHPCCRRSFILFCGWSGPITSWEIDGEAVETVSDFILWGSKITADGDCSHEIKRRLLLGRKVMTNLESIHTKKQRHYFANKDLSSQGYGFSSCHIWMRELDCEDSWAPKNWCFWTVVLEKTLESLGLQGDPASPS